MGAKKPGGAFKEVTHVVIKDKEGVGRPFVLLKINPMKSQTHHLMNEIYSTLFSRSTRKIDECHEKYQISITGSTSIYAASRPEKIQFCVGAILRDLKSTSIFSKNSQKFSSDQYIEKST